LVTGLKYSVGSLGTSDETSFKTALPDHFIKSVQILKSDKILKLVTLSLLPGLL
jgi:hypothetical protein